MGTAFPEQIHLKAHRDLDLNLGNRGLVSTVFNVRVKGGSGGPVLATAEDWVGCLAFWGCQVGVVMVSFASSR